MMWSMVGVGGNVVLDIDYCGTFWTSFLDIHSSRGLS
jgi:hypothetical protein